MTIFPEKLCFASFQNSEQKRFGLLLEKFRRGCQNSISRFHRNILKEYFTEKKFSFCFRHSPIQLWPSVRKFSGELSEPHPTCPEESFEELFLKILNLLRTLRVNISAFHPENFAEVVKTIFYVSIGTFWWTLFYSKQTFWWTNFSKENRFSFPWPSAVKLLLFDEVFSAQVSELHSTWLWNFLKNFVSEEKLISFGQWPKFLRRFVEFPLMGLSKLHPSCPWDRFEKNYFFWNKNRFCFPTLSDIEPKCFVLASFLRIFWIIFGHWEINFRLFMQKLSPRLSKLFYVSIGTFWRK